MNPAEVLSLILINITAISMLYGIFRSLDVVAISLCPVHFVIGYSIQHPVINGNFYCHERVEIMEKVLQFDLRKRSA